MYFVPLCKHNNQRKSVMKKYIFIWLFVFSGLTVVKSQQAEAQPLPLPPAQLKTKKEFTDINEALKTPKEVYRLNLAHKPFNPKRLYEFQNLQELDISGNEIVKLTYISQLKNLQHLYADECAISSLVGVDELIGMEVMSLAANSIEDLEPLTHLIYLKKLHLNSNQISDISALSNMLYMEDLNLSHNLISSIFALANMSRLKVLNLAHNQITDISILSRLKDLKELHLEGNPDIKSFAPIEELTQLEQLYLPQSPKITVEWINNLKKKLPKCSIHIVES